MKYLKTINELKKETYMSAADKLNKLGGKHIERSKNLIEWVNEKEKDRIYKMNQIFDYDRSKKKQKENEEVEYRLVFISNFLRDYMLNNEDDGDVKCLYFGFMFEPLYPEKHDLEENNADLFTIAIYIDKVNNKLTPTGEYLIEPSFYNKAILFSNRKDAVRFKKNVFNVEFFRENCDDFEFIEELFYEYGSKDNFDKIFEVLNSIKINNLWS